MVSWPDTEVWALLGLIGGAMVLGGVVGLDRELANRSAGLRTHMLVAGAAAVFATLGEILLRGYDRGIEPDILRSDPLRIIGAVITESVSSGQAQSSKRPVAIKVMEWRA